MDSPKIPLSHTLWSPHDTVKDAAELLGINLPEDAGKNLAMDVEYRIHEILETAIKFMRHAKRKLLTTADVDRALKMLNIEPLYGYDVLQPFRFKEAMVGAGGQTLYYVDDHEVEFEKLINQPLPSVPRHASFTAHWLAVEGVQPMILQNPLPLEVRALPPIVRGATTSALGLGWERTEPLAAAAAAPGSIAKNGSAPGPKKDAAVKPLVKHVLLKELQLYFDKVAEVLVSTDPEKETLKYAALTLMRNDPGLHQLVPYFIQFAAEQITNQLRNIEVILTMLEVILALVENKTLFLDPYVHALMPCILTLLLAKRIGPAEAVADPAEPAEPAEPLGSPGALEALEAAPASAGESAAAVPASAGESAAAAPASAGDSAAAAPASAGTGSALEHLAVREFAAILLHHIISVYGSLYLTLTPRVTRTLLRALLDPTKPVGTHYGALLGLQNMGSEVIKLVLVGNLKVWSRLVLERNRTEREREVLVGATIDTLRKLAEPAGDAMEEDVSPEVQAQLKERIGEYLGGVVLQQKDAKAIVRGIFLGEVNV